MRKKDAEIIKEIVREMVKSAAPQTRAVPSKNTSTTRLASVLQRVARFFSIPPAPVQLPRAGLTTRRGCRAAAKDSKV